MLLLLNTVYTHHTSGRTLAAAVVQARHFPSAAGTKAVRTKNGSATLAKLNAVLTGRHEGRGWADAERMRGFSLSADNTPKSSMQTNIARLAML